MARKKIELAKNGISRKKVVNVGEEIADELQLPKKSNIIDKNNDKKV
ncbi:22741_t:CDS:2, partial [Racocetra persica]